MLELSSFDKYDFTSTDQIRQSFEFKTWDNNAKKVKLERVFLQTYFWAGSNAEINFNIYEGGINDGGGLIHTQPFSTEFWGANTIVSTPAKNYIQIDQEVVLVVNKRYTFEISATAISERAFGFYLTKSNYSNGSCNLGAGDLWFHMIGQVDSETDTEIEFTQATSNQFSFDIYSYQFPTKLIGTGKTEKIIVSSNKLGSLSFEVINSDIAQINSINNNEIEISGIKQGKTRLLVKEGSDTIDYVLIDVRDRKVIDVSYQYIAFPGEESNVIIEDSANIMAAITPYFDTLNIEVRFTNQGVFYHEWDLNNDGSSYDANRAELESCFSVIPNADQFFSNIYLLRLDKDPDYKQGTNGGGTSYEIGAESEPPRYSLVRAHFFKTTEMLSNTLGHELSHNLGLAHYNSQNYENHPAPYEELNMMKTGRQMSKFFAFQWDIMHNTIDYRANQGEVYGDVLTSSVILDKVDGLLVYPNPSLANKIFLENGNEGMDYEIYSVTG